MKTITSSAMPNSKTKLSPILTLLLCLSTLAQAAPVGGVVTSGGATISSAGSNTTINQSTSKAIINWQGFNVGASESVRFNQPSSSAIVLNRVVGPDGSSIMGNISANGRVFLINPNGILFGSGSQVNVGGLVASTLGMTDANFLAGNYQFTGNSPAAILNQGTLNTNIDAGYIALLGANVSNTGVITARLGTVVLAAGNGITLDVAGDSLLNVSVNEGAVNALVSNGHLIMADGGQVLMTARGASSLLSNAVNNTGLIQAQSIESANGLIILSAGPDTGVVNVSGTLDASGLGSGQTGGTVELLGGTVNLSNASIDVSGNTGGGQAIVGGNFNGAGPQPNSLHTNIDSTSTINADATESGNGGKIAVWSDNTTVMDGTLTARGGALSGDGGFIETSGKKVVLADTAYINTLSPNGETGMWLLDPEGDYTIADTIPLGEAGETPAAVTASLASSNRTITAINDINVDSAITWSTPQDLSLIAGHDVNIRAAITASTAGAQVNMTAGNDVLISNAITSSGENNQINITSTSGNILATGTITASSSGTQLNMISGNNLTVGTVTTDGGGSMNLRAKGNVSVDTASAAASPGTVTLYADSDGSGIGTVIIGSTITSTNTTIRFNPTSYATTSTEVAAYGSKTTGGTDDIKAWVFLQGNNKTYDQSTADTLSFKGAPTDASAVTLVSGTASFADKNAGVDKAVTYSGYSLGGTATDLVLYSSSGTTTATISQAPLLVSATGVNKVYDTTTSANATLNSTPLSGDIVSASYVSASFTDKAAASDKPITVNGITLSGTDAENYNANTTANTTATISQAPLLVSATGTNKVFDGTTTDVVTLSATPLSGDSVLPGTYTSANFSNTAVGVNKPVSVVGIALTGADASNYSYNTTASTTASITPSSTPNPASNVNGLEIVPVVPQSGSSQAPIALQEDMRNGVSTPPIVPFVGTGIAAGSLLATQASNQSNLLTVADPQKGAELQSLFPPPVIAPYRAPKQGRN